MKLGNDHKWLGPEFMPVGKKDAVLARKGSYL
jgi:hypothetical protein